MQRRNHAPLGFTQCATVVVQARTVLEWMPPMLTEAPSCNRQTIELVKSTSRKQVPVAQTSFVASASKAVRPECVVIDLERHYGQGPDRGDVHTDRWAYKLVNAPRVRAVGGSVMKGRVDDLACRSVSTPRIPPSLYEDIRASSAEGQ